MNTQEIYKGINIDIPQFKSDLEKLSRIKLAYDVAGTESKANDAVDIEFLRNVQMKGFSELWKKLRMTNEPVRFCHRGDSLTFGLDSTSPKEVTYTYSDGSTYTNKQSLTTYPQAMENMLKKVYGNDKILSHINRGRGGDWASLSLTRHNGIYQADCTLVMLGTNDSRLSNCPYTGNVQEYIYWLEQIVIQELLWNKCIVLLTSPVTKLQNDYKVDTFSNASKLIAAKYGIPIIDTQEILNGYQDEIWSDTTHLSELGYTILGTRLASAFIGEGLSNIFKVGNNMSKEIAIMTSNTVTNSDVVYQHSRWTDTPNHNIIDGSRYGYMYKFSTKNGKCFVSFYTEEDNLYVIPSAYIRENCGIKLLLDNGLIAADNTLDSSIFNNVIEVDNNRNEFIQLATSTTSVRVNKKYLKENVIEPLRIPNRGWHTIEISAIDNTGNGIDPINLFGIECVGFNEMYLLLAQQKMKPSLIYSAGLNPDGTIPRPNIGDKITLVDDITKYNLIYITTGNVSSGTLSTYTVRNIGDRNFVVGDTVSGFTMGGKWISISITKEKEMTYTKVDNEYPVRDIYGVKSI